MDCETNSWQARLYGFTYPLKGSHKLAPFTAETLGLSYLDGLNWAAGLARHAEDAVGFPDWVRFVRSVPVPLFATLLNRLVLACSHLSGIESPFEEGNRTHIQTNTISYAGIPIDPDHC